MKYLLRTDGLGKVPEIEITKKEYDEFEKAQNILSNALEIEEIYEIVIVNYLDFEKQISNSIADYMVRGNIDYSSFFYTRLGLNIRLLNLLSAARLYIDKIKQSVPECVPKVTDAEEIVVKFLNKEWDENKDYRFMGALRDYGQHRGIPVHWTQQGGRWTSLEDDGLMEYYMELGSQYSYLKDDRKFKKKVLAESSEKIDLKAATRSYVESISCIHESVRAMINESITLARKLIEDAHHRYEAVYKDSQAGLSASKCSDKKQISTIPLLLEWDNIRVELQKRNRKLINLRKRYITGTIKIHNK